MIRILIPETGLTIKVHLETVVKRQSGVKPTEAEEEIRAALRALGSWKTDHSDCPNS